LIFNFLNKGYAFQKPVSPLKSGKPLSTPIPAPAVIKIASLLLIHSFALFYVVL